jgi:transcriptional regulator with XRE-family HTH domain
MGVSQPTVAGFERYDANPTLSTLRRYALAIGARLETRVIDDIVRYREFGATVTGGAFTAPAEANVVPVVNSWTPTTDRLPVHA